MLMQSSQPAELPASLGQPVSDQAVSRWVFWSWSGLIVLLVANLPLMICMPLTADPVIYDLQAKVALEGGVLYRDIAEPNLPGVVWVQMAVRSLGGWSSYTLRGFDLLVFAGIVVLLIRLARNASFARNFRLRTPMLALLLCWCYFSLSEWVHCQRDTWMMLPALGALCLRVHQLRRFSSGEGPTKKQRYVPSPLGGESRVRGRTIRPLFFRRSEARRNDLLLWGGLEGVLWGIAFWIKPFVAIPALASLVVSAGVMGSGRGTLLNFSGVLLGGMFCGLIGSIWLIETGAWPHFWEMALNWNPHYLEAGRERWTWGRYASMLNRFLPWSLVHLVAIPLALRNLFRLPWRREGDHSQSGVYVLSAAYLGWLLQAHTLQYLFDYAHVPAMLLGLGLLVVEWPAQRPALPLAPLAPLGLASFLLIALLNSSATSPARLAWWGRCVTQGSTPAVRNGLQQMPLPDWEELQPVIEFLKAQDLQDGELTAYHVFLIHLYPELDLKPSTRYAFLDVYTRIFKDRTALIADALNDSPHRFVVSSLLENGMNVEDISPFAADQPPELPARFPPEERRLFPYNQKLVFRSGQYVVHEIIQPVGELNTRSFPLRRPAQTVRGLATKDTKKPGEF